MLCGGWRPPNLCCSQISVGVLHKSICLDTIQHSHLVFSVMYTFPFSHHSPGFRDPSTSAGPPGVTEWMKIPRSSFPVFSPPTIWKPIEKGPKHTHMSVSRVEVSSAQAGISKQTKKLCYSIKCKIKKNEPIHLKEVYMKVNGKAFG